MSTINFDFSSKSLLVGAVGFGATYAVLNRVLKLHPSVSASLSVPAGFTARILAFVKTSPKPINRQSIAEEVVARAAALCAMQGQISCREFGLVNPYVDSGVDVTLPVNKIGAAVLQIMKAKERQTFIYKACVEAENASSNDIQVAIQCNQALIVMEDLALGKARSAEDVYEALQKLALLFHYKPETAEVREFQEAGRIRCCPYAKSNLLLVVDSKGRKCFTVESLWECLEAVELEKQ